MWGKAAAPITFAVYRRRYLAEITARPEAGKIIAGLAARVAAGETITLLCSSACADEATCHRASLRDLILTGRGGGAGRASSRAARGR